MSNKNTEQEGFGDPPPDLGEVGIYYWKEISGYLESKGLTGVEYRGMFLLLCQLYEDLAEYRKNIKRMGTTITSERGTVRNPDCMNANQVIGNIAKLSAQFGLTPLSQGKVKSPDKKKAVNPFSDI